METILKDPQQVKEIMEEIHKMRRENADTWYNVQVELLKEVTKKHEAILKQEIDQSLSDYKENQMIDLMSQFDSLESNNKRDLEAYLQANPQRQELYEQISQKAKAYKGKKKIPPQRVQPPKCTFEDEVPNLLAILAENGVNLNDLVVFADNAFLFKGKIYDQGSEIYLQTRQRDNPIKAILHDITEFEITLEFVDKGLLTIATKEILNGSVEILNDVNNKK
ncbi:hypothetical protein TVAG_010190 [Trichomonas vaginalis G3]|uniref:Uncharacterized protein n=1 Tax=Trichomonas vaginalis (strain ATCC PRA-98 / G3) TaxID=412133 RepID=A2FA34_TRIV3|nr:hypothetical protein TVAGG3_0082820 [Trichomonas vaginalis G3]EAX98242.1 hypothetical protein TVAG_010190 [Trichomonas vaginalis G3]KAI5543383.1 hypothetical protein TVAGG3_0082820 [Trichomonas vaginalis G3]|eukprot:XP_001311172.1 hypothetical protein [Trichomonas vaginalis G3]